MYAGRSAWVRAWCWSSSTRDGQSISGRNERSIMHGPLSSWGSGLNLNHPVGRLRPDREHLAASDEVQLPGSVVSHARTHAQPAPESIAGQRVKWPLRFVSHDLVR